MCVSVHLYHCVCAFVGVSLCVCLYLYKCLYVSVCLGVSVRVCLCVSGFYRAHCIFAGHLRRFLLMSLDKWRTVQQGGFLATERLCPKNLVSLEGTQSG